MGVTPTAGVPSSRTDLILPIGTKGLPLTIQMADHYDDTLVGLVNRKALFDTGLQQPSATGSGLSVNPAPSVPSAILNDSAMLRPPLPLDPVKVNPRAAGLTMNTSSPSLNFETGALEFGQAVQDISRSYHSAGNTRSSLPMSRLSLSEVGRYSPQYRRRYSSGRAGNHTWNQTKTTDNDTPPSIDRTWGAVSARGTFDCSVPTFPEGPRIEAITHSAKADIPSNGFGISWGDAHNATYLTTLCSSPINNAAATGAGLPIGMVVSDDDLDFSSHWALNLGVRQPILASGCSFSSPDGVPFNVAEDAATTALLVEAETIQAITVSDILSDGTAPPTTQAVHSLGRVDLGNHAISDSCGLIGYEGIMTATAFFNISKNTDPLQSQGAISHTNKYTYAGLNIQVHSGTTMRRNGDPTLTGIPLYPFQYGSDAKSVDVMTDAMKTSAARSESEFDQVIDANTSQFSTRRSNDGFSSPNQKIPIDQGGQFEIAAGSGLFTQAEIVADRLFGDVAKAGDVWAGAQTLSSGWLSDGIPTKVQVIPQVLGYENVNVTAGGAKLAAYPDAQTIVFRKPIVDYHVLVSVADRSELVVKANTSAGVSPIGSPTIRNAPDSNRLHADMDLSGLPCTIYHGIMRINPTTLEQCYIDPAQIPSGYTAAQSRMEDTVMPRHNTMQENVGGAKASMGWGLHQITPFRPMASRMWQRVPKLCGAIESGGTYQRGGISHLFDAQVYGDELFIGADMIDATDFATATVHADGNPDFGVWGRGQVWPNGNPLPQMPQGIELMIFRYDRRMDPYHPSKKATSSTNNPLRDALGINGSAVNGLTAYSAQYKTGFAISAESLLMDSAWSIHDWVIPQLELMRYLGQENKSAVMHPKHSGYSGSTPILHPTVHCSSLRIMDDGKMMMAMVHRDYIATASDYPTADIAYPPNPDAGIGSCPAGYYLSEGQCVPISGTNPPDAGNVADPLSGDERPSSGNPSPSIGSNSDGPPQSDNFGEYPTWSQLKANTSARSLILAFTDASNLNGQVAKGLGGKAFSVKWELVPISDGTTQELANQTWSQADTWWSGARISYWYEESGQRAIPITYGSYPEARLSHATLPKSLPWLDNGLTVRHGYPYKQPLETIAPCPRMVSIDERIPLDPWMVQRQAFLAFTRFTPTTIGFADFGAGANPHQELGWSGWSQPQGIYDAINYGDNTQFFSDDPAALAVAAGVAITPTKQGIWKDFGDNQDFNLTAGTYAPYAATIMDCSNITFPIQLIEFIVDGQNMMLAPQLVNNMTEVLAAILNPIHSLWAATQEPLYIPYGGSTVLDASGTKIIRMWQDTPIIQPVEVFNPTGESFAITKLMFGNGDATISAVRSSVGQGLMNGPIGGWSHQGPLHYGMSATLHPYRVDRVFKQVHGGAGYDLPLHLLIPANVHVRARAGGRGAIDLEMETPFHRTDNLHLIGASALNAGFDQGGLSPPAGTRSVGGQFYLRTNLWDAPMASPPASAKIGGYASNLQRIHGPVVSGTGLTAFWSDHPTDHFHAAAMPILPATDYDLALIESNRYSPLMLARASEMHDLDVLATSEQLLSSVDVHVSQTARPMWDSGAIVSAQGIGQEDAKGANIEALQNEQCDGSVPFPYSLSRGSATWGLGKGQRIVRTPDGTLHQFVMKRSARVGSNNEAQWCHMKKPLGSDVFFSRRAMKASPDTSTYDGKDEVGPLMYVLGMGTQSSYGGKARLMGSAFASDSNGTIHAVVEIHANPDDESEHRAHRLYYCKAVRRLVSSNPNPVYDWDWSAHTPVLINSTLATTQSAGGTRWDLRMPSLVCDSKDRLHLTVAQPLLATESSYSNDITRILYTCKLPEDASFETWNPTDSSGAPNDGLWSVVNGIQTAAGQNLPAAPPHFTNINYWPKICLRSDDIPVVFYWGLADSDYSSSDRREGAIYTNIGEGGVSGRFTFDTGKCCHVVGLPPDSRNTYQSKYVMYYDAIVDERDKAVVVAIKDDRQTTAGQTWANRQTLMNRFDANRPLANQYDATNGLGDTRTLLMGPTYNGSTELRYIDTYYENPTLTTDGKGEYHLVMGCTYTGSDPRQQGKTFRDAIQGEESSISPLQWPTTPLTDSATNELYKAGYAGASVESPNWPETPTPPYSRYASETKSMHHLMHIWFPSYEFDDDATAPDRVIRSINIRWLSVPSLRYDATKGWIPIGSAQTLAGNEDFPHLSSQCRYQRFWGYDAGEIDLSWKTNELSWFTTPHAGSKLYYPSVGGFDFNLGSSNVGEGLVGFPSGV